MAVITGRRVSARRTVLFALAGLLAGAVACTGSTQPTAPHPSRTGSSTPTPGLPCPGVVGSALAGGRQAQVRVHVLTRDAQITDCRYTASGLPATSCTAVTVMINDESQAYVDFRRWVDESGQNRQHPKQVSGPGLGSDWVVQEHLFQAGSATRWVTVTLTCPPHASGTLRLARHIATIAMHA